MFGWWLDRQMDEYVYEWKVMREINHTIRKILSLFKSFYLGGYLISWFPNLTAHKVYLASFICLGHAFFGYSESTSKRWDTHTPPRNPYFNTLPRECWNIWSTDWCLGVISLTHLSITMASYSQVFNLWDVQPLFSLMLSLFRSPERGKYSYDLEKFTRSCNNSNNNVRACIKYILNKC